MPTYRDSRYSKSLLSGKKSNHRLKCSASKHYNGFLLYSTLPLSGLFTGCCHRVSMFFFCAAAKKELKKAALYFGNVCLLMDSMRAYAVGQSLRCPKSPAACFAEACYSNVCAGTAAQVLRTFTNNILIGK